MERDTRFELATPALARQCSTTELVPQSGRDYKVRRSSVNHDIQGFRSRGEADAWDEFSLPDHHEQLGEAALVIIDDVDRHDATTVARIVEEASGRALVVLWSARLPKDIESLPAVIAACSGIVIEAGSTRAAAGQPGGSSRASGRCLPTPRSVIS